MNAKKFQNISKSECLIIYKEILENSESKWDEGVLLAKTRNFGSAISLAIISVEELIKALLLLADGKGFNFRSMKGIDALFNSHKIRYLIAYAMFVLKIAGEELAKQIMKWRDNPEELIRDNKKLTQGDEKFEKKVERYFLRKFIVFRREFKWFSNVDVFRQDGFYCDYDEQLKNPIKITEKEYLEVFERLEKVRITGQTFVDIFNDSDDFYSKQLHKLKGDFKSKKYYELIGEKLEEIRKTRQSPFDFINQKLPKKR